MRTWKSFKTGGAGPIQLTTVLAHSAGEWVSSDWPVWSVSETAAPNRKGTTSALAKPVLAPNQSAVLPDRLVAVVDCLQSTDESAGWAHRNHPPRNTLTVEDAGL